MDLLFLHTPKFQNYYKPIGEFSFILFPPLGLLGLADYLVESCRSGISPEAGKMFCYSNLSIGTVTHVECFRAFHLNSAARFT
jgi:hypothetical protein